MKRLPDKPEQKYFFFLRNLNKVNTFKYMRKIMSVSMDERVWRELVRRYPVNRSAVINEVIAEFCNMVTDRGKRGRPRKVVK